jgi:hypothetical protein
MAVVTVAADNTRVNAADDTTGWTNIGGGGGIANETDVTYQNNIAQSRKIGTTLLGRGYDYSPSTVDMTVLDSTTWLCKVAVTNYGVLLTRSAPALHVRVGSSSADTYDYYVAGSDNYPPKGGWLLLGIDPNVSGYRDATNGSGHDLTLVDYFGVLADFSTGSKAENVIIDALDVGAGLHLVGGDGGDTDGVFQDFVDYDEGTVANRYGYVFTETGIVFVNGRLSIGENTSKSPVATVFDDIGSLVVWRNGYFATGYARLRFNLGDASTSCTLSNVTLIGAGEKDNTLGLGYTTTEDTRPILEASGTSGSLTLNSCIAQNFQDVSLTSVCTIDGGDFETESMTQGSADIANCIIRTMSPFSVAAIADPTFGETTDLHDVEFIQVDSGTYGHAVEISSVGDYTFTNLTWTGYGTTGTDSAALDVTPTSGTVNISVNGGTSPTYKTAGATVNVTQTVVLKITAKDTAGDVVSGAQAAIFALETVGDVTVGDELLTGSGGVDTDAVGVAQNTAFNYQGDLNVEVRIRKSSPSDNPRYKNYKSPGLVIDTGFTTIATLIVDDTLT